MIGRQGCQTMDMNGASSASHLACTPLFCTWFKKVETEGLSDWQRSATIISFVHWKLRTVICSVDSKKVIGTFRPQTFEAGEKSRKGQRSVLLMPGFMRQSDFECLFQVTEHTKKSKKAKGGQVSSLKPPGPEREAGSKRPLLELGRTGLQG